MIKYLFLKKERFSIRKFSVGAASVLIGTSLFAGAGSAHAEETTVATSAKTVDLHYLNEKELTADEQKLLENFQKSHTVEADDVAYYYVYRPSQKSLPNTGSTEIAGLAVAGATLLVAALVLSRKNKRLAVTLFALGSGGLLTTTVLADSQLAQFFENAQVAVNGDIPQPKAIEGYEFTGYFYRRKESKSTTTPVVPQVDKDKPVPTPVTPLEPVKPVQPDEKKDENADKPNPKPEPNPQPEQVKTAKGDQTDGGSANIEPALPEFSVDQVPVETAKGDQSDGGSANVEPALPEFPVDQVPVETAKGDQTEGGSANVEPALPEFPVDQVPVETAKGDQSDGGSANVEPALPEYPVDQVPVETAKGDQTEGGSATVEPALPEFPIDQVPVETAKGDQTDGGSANVEPALPEFPVDQVPVETAKGDQTDGGSATVEPALPEFPIDQVPVETAKGDQTDGGSANVEPALPEFPVDQVPVETAKGDQTDGGSANVEPSLPEYPVDQVPVETAKGDQSDGGSANVEPALPEYPVDQVPVETAKGDQTDGGSATVEPALPEYPVDQVPVATAKGDQTEGGSATVEPALPEFPIKPLPEPKTVTEELPIPVRYEADDSLEPGQRQEILGKKGQKTTTTTYTLDDKTGEIIPVVGEPVITEAQPTVIKIGTKPQSKSETLAAHYLGDAEQELGYLATVAGTPKIITTTYTVNPDTGEVTSQETVTNPGQAEVITKGIKPTESQQDLPTVYQGDDEKEVGTQTEIVGSPRVTLTTYTVDEATGVVTPTATITSQGSPRIVVKGTKPTTRPEDLPVVYKADDTKDFGTQSETAGSPRVTTTTYTVNANTGEVTASTTVTSAGEAKVITKGTKPTTVSENLPVVYKADETKDFGTQTVTAGSPRVTTTTYTVNANTGEVTSSTAVTSEGASKVITKGTKPTVVEEALAFTTRYEADPTLAYQAQAEKTAGQDGKTVTTTSYILDEKTGEVTANPSSTQTIPAVTRVVGVGNVQTSTAPIAIVEKTIQDDQLDKGVQEIRQEGVAGETTTTMTYTVDAATGQLSQPKSETVTSKPMQERIIAIGTKEIREKLVDFNDVTSRELYRVTENGEMERVTGLETVPQDTSNYVLKLIRRDHKDVLLPVNSITESNSGFEITSNGAEFKDPEKFVLSKVKTYEGAYTQFDTLLAAMKANTSGTYKVGADLVATPLKDGESYLANFTGTLESADPERNFTISNLSKPLFTTLSGTVKNINLDVNVSAVKAAALAVTANNATISNVHVKGTVAAAVQTAGDVPEVAGLIIETTGTTQLTDVSMSGDLSITKNPYAFNLEVGGIVSKLTSGSIDRALSDLNYSINFKGGYAGMANKYVGGIAGQLGMGSTLNHVVAKGTINTSQIDGGATPGAIAGANIGGTISNTLNMTQDTTTNSGVTGLYAGPTTNTNVLDTLPNAAASGAKVVTADQANQLISDWKIKTFADTTSNSNAGTTTPATDSSTPLDYTQVDGAVANRAIAYANTAKLLPFYDAVTIVDYGNKIASTDKLFTTQVTAVVPLAGETPIGVTPGNAQTITQILIHYADGSVEKRAVQALGLYKDSRVYEYQLANGLLFTPEQLMTDRSSLTQELAAEFKKVTFDSPEMQAAVKLAEANANQPAEQTYKMDDLFWKSSFNAVQENIQSILEQVLTNNTVLGNSEPITQASKQKLLDKKAQVLVGLSYLARLYDIHFEDLSLKNILTYRPDFYGQKQDVIDWLASFADLSFKDLQVMNNEATYAKQIAPITKQATVKDFLESQRASFAPGTTTQAWYKNTTKASVYEVASSKNPSADVSLYTWLTSYQDFRSYLLPLLNLRDDSIYITTNMSFITFGLKDRHVADKSLRTTNPTQYAAELAKVDQTVAVNATRWAKFVDTWYGIVDDSVKSKMVRPLLSVWAGFQMGATNADWLSPYDTTYPAMEDFLAATGEYFSWASKPASARSGIRQQDGNWIPYSKIEYVQTDLLTDEGAATLSHEFVHALDQVALLDGHQRRPDQDAESFAYGMLESAITPNDFYYALNLMQDFKGELATSNQSNARFASADDLGNYVKGLYDVTYTLDAIEAENILKLSKNDQKRFFDKIEPVNYRAGSNGTTNNDDRIRALTDTEWNAMNLRSINDLIDNNLVAYDTSVYINKDYVQTDVFNYYTISLSSPIYAGFQSTTGTSSGLLFRKMAWDLLAAKGWKEGFIPFATDALLAQAQAENKVLTDDYAFKAVMGDQNLTYAQFKKNMYQEHLTAAKDGKLQTITINWNGGQHTIASYDDLNRLMQQAVTIDNNRAAQMNNRLYVQQNARKSLKEAIIKAYQQTTDNFRSSIYK